MERVRRTASHQPHKLKKMGSTPIPATMKYYATDTQQNIGKPGAYLTVNVSPDLFEEFLTQLLDNH